MELFLEVAQKPLHRDFFTKCGILECLDCLQENVTCTFIYLLLFRPTCIVCELTSQTMAHLQTPSTHFSLTESAFLQDDFLFQPTLVTASDEDAH